MTANEIADDLNHVYELSNIFECKAGADMIRQQQAEIEALKLRELTDEEIYSEMIKCIDEPEDGHTFRYKDFARAILKKASEK